MEADQSRKSNQKKMGNPLLYDYGINHMLLTKASFDLRPLSLPVSVCLSVPVSPNISAR